MIFPNIGIQKKPQNWVFFGGGDCNKHFFCSNNLILRGQIVTNAPDILENPPYLSRALSSSKDLKVLVGSNLQLWLLFVGLFWPLRKKLFGWWFFGTFLGGGNSNIFYFQIFFKWVETCWNHHLVQYFIPFYAPQKLRCGQTWWRWVSFSMGWFSGSSR